MRNFLNRALQLILFFVFFYTLFILLFMFSSLRLANEAKGLSAEFRKNGYSERVKTSYNSFIMDFDKTLAISDSVLVRPILKLTKYENDFNKIIEIHSYLKPLLRTLPEILGGTGRSKYLVVFQNYLFSSTV